MTRGESVQVKRWQYREAFAASTVRQYGLVWCQRRALLKALQDVPQHLHPVQPSVTWEAVRFIDDPEGYAWVECAAHDAEMFCLRLEWLG